MIPDPGTTPDSRAGRILFATLVAASAAYIQFGLYRTNGLLWSLTVVSPKRRGSTSYFLEQNINGIV